MQGEDELPQQLYSLWKDNEHLSDRSFVPENSLVDEPITIQLRNVHQENGHFPIGTHLFVSAFLYDEKENLYYSLSFFEMNNTPLDLSFCKALPFTAIQSSLKPVQGDLAPHFSAPANKVEDRETYTNIEKMAFIWSMKPVPGCRFGLRYSHRDVTKPMRVHIMIGKCYKQSDSIVFERITSGTTNRWYHREEYTIRKEISTETGVVGTLFTPRKPGKYLAVIDLFGTAGGITEFRAALLAERGFIAMALPYFGYKHLPESFYGITLEYFEEAIDWMSSLPMVDARKGIGLTGVSYGAELALLCGSYFSNRVGAVVAISTSDSNTNGDISYKGQLIPHASPNYDEITFLQMKDTRKDFLPAENGGDVHALIDGISTCQELITDPETPEAKKARIEYEKSQAALLLVSGRSDCNWPAAKFSRQIMDWLDKHQYAYGHKHICYELTGHLIEPPYAPFCSYSYHKILFGSIMWGGVGSAHNFAQEHSWHSILQFLRTSLQGSNL